MKKQFIVLVVVILLASCTSFPQNTQTSNATQVASSSVDESWQTYTNAEVGFSIQYPADWNQEDLPDENAGQRHHIIVQGPEGGVELLWGVGFGGACPDGYQPLAVAQGSWSACRSQRDDGTELWSLAAQPVGDTDFSGFVYTNDTTDKSREVVLQVFSTLSFP